jgi:hypothetical protein
MAGHLRRGDVLAGGVAAVALPLLVFVVGVTPWGAIPLAVAIYAGLMLLRPRGGRRRDEAGDDAVRQRLAHEAARANAVAIRALGLRIPKPAVRDQVGRIADLADRVLAVMRADQNLAAAPPFNDRVLEPARSLLAAYVHLSTRGVRGAGALLEKTETRDLPMIEQAVGAYYEKLHRASVVDLATLGEVLELNLESIAASRPRRSLP